MLKLITGIVLLGCGWWIAGCDCGDTNPITGDGKVTDGSVHKDGPKSPDGPQGDRAMNDAPYGDGSSQDGPGNDAPYGDGPKSDGPNNDAPSGDGLTTDAPFIPVPDLFVWQYDGVPPLDVITGQNDAGYYLCTSSLGVVHLCECNDGIENDTDNKVDYPADPGCLGPWDDSELDGNTACTDGKDNDGDLLIDAADPGCTSPLDNDESSWATGIPGDNVDPCKQDCFFDGNSGSGDDKCTIDLKCDPILGQYVTKKNGDPCYDPQNPPTNCPSTPPPQSAECLKNCQPVTPNGCDCFGCCEITYGGVTKTVYMTPSCEPQYINDTTKCFPCTPDPLCINPCGPCEVCIGHPTPDPGCFAQGDAGFIWDGAPPIQDGGTTPFCCCGYQYCGPGGIDPNQCPPGTYCITGCCVPID